MLFPADIFHSLHTEDQGVTSSALQEEEDWSMMEQLLISYWNFTGKHS